MSEKLAAPRESKSGNRPRGNRQGYLDSSTGREPYRKRPLDCYNSGRRLVAEVGYLEDLQESARTLENEKKIAGPKIAKASKRKKRGSE
jgi:hypothetical protein